MLPPHGGTLVDRILPAERQEQALEEANELVQLNVSDDLAKDIENIAFGAFSPLEGFLCQRRVRVGAAREATQQRSSMDAANCAGRVKGRAEKRKGRRHRSDPRSSKGTGRLTGHRRDLSLTGRRSSPKRSSAQPTRRTQAWQRRTQ